MHIRRFAAVLLVLSIMGISAGSAAYADPAPLASFSYAGVSVSSDLTLYIGAKVDASIASPSVLFDGAGRSERVSGTRDGNLWRFEYGGIYSQYMADIITMKVMDGETVLAESTYSLRQYFNDLYASTAAALRMSDEQFTALKKLMADILEYGAMAQNYSQYKTSDLANNPAWVATEKTQTFTAPASAAAITKHGTAANRFKSATLILTNFVSIKFSVVADAATKVVISNSDASVTRTFALADCEKDGTGAYEVRFGGLAATEFDTVWNASLEDEGGTVYCSVTYSVNSYVASTCGSEEAVLAGIVKAAYNYGVSADAYQTIADAAGNGPFISVGGEDDEIDDIEGGNF